MIGKIIEKLYNQKALEPISGLDATFLYAETPTSPMHVGSVAVIEGSIKFKDFRETILSRLPLIPKMRKRLMEVPLSIDYPYWADDANFDPDMHLQHIALPEPGGWKELRNTAAQIFSKPLDHSRPLWSFTFIEGLNTVPQVPKGSVAIVSKMHHVAIDGVAGAGMLALLFDMTPDAKKIENEDIFIPERLPNDFALMLKSSMSFIKRPLKLPRIIAKTVQASLQTGVLTRAQHIQMPAAPFSAPKTPLNGIISARRKWNAAILSLDRIKTIKNTMETTLNDVMLAICAGALRRYLHEKGKLPKKPLVAMVPISTRSDDEKSSMGNQISSMLIQLATDIEDPIERLEAIHENAQGGKSYQRAIGAKTLATMAEAVPFGVANQAARLYSRYRIAALHNPIFNVTITNVPGPQFPLYLNGHKLLSIMGMAPVIDGMGLIITIFSYNGQVTVCPTSDARTMPDLNIFSRYLRESANELEAEVLKRGKSKKKATKKEKGLETEFIFVALKDYFKGHPNNRNKGVVLIRVNGEKQIKWRVDLNKSPVQLRKGGASKPDTVLTLDDKDLIKLYESKIDYKIGVVQGKILVEGQEKNAAYLVNIIKNLK